MTALLGGEQRRRGVGAKSPGHVPSGSRLLAIDANPRRGPLVATGHSELVQTGTPFTDPSPLW